MRTRALICSALRAFVIASAKSKYDWTPRREGASDGGMRSEDPSCLRMPDILSSCRTGGSLRAHTIHAKSSKTALTALRHLMGVPGNKIRNLSCIQTPLMFLSRHSQAYICSVSPFFLWLKNRSSIKALPHRDSTKHCQQHKAGKDSYGSPTTCKPHADGSNDKPVRPALAINPIDVAGTDMQVTNAVIMERVP